MLGAGRRKGDDEDGGKCKTMSWVGKQSRAEWRIENMGPIWMIK